MNVHSRQTAAEAEITALLDRCMEGLRTLDTEAVLACHTPDVVCFDCHSQFEARGREAMRTFLDACFPHMVGPTEIERQNLAIEADGDAGFCHYHLHSISRGRSGEKHGGWLRVTLGVRRTGGEWLASHVHVSAPFNPMTGATMFGLDREASPWESGACSAS